MYVGKKIYNPAVKFFSSTADAVGSKMGHGVAAEGACVGGSKSGGMFFSNNKNIDQPFTFIESNLGKNGAKGGYKGGKAVKSSELFKKFGVSIRNDLPLTYAQKLEIIEYAEALGMPKNKIYFYEDLNTSYGRIFGNERLHVGLDVLPKSGKPGITANSRVSMKGAVAHELEGHRAAELAGKTQSHPVLEEAQASIRAARFAEGLSDTERFTLLRDAIERLKSAGIKVQDVKSELWISECSSINLNPRNI